MAALNEGNSPSIAQNREFGGLIYRNADGTYGYTEPSPGTGASFDPTSVSAPAGATVVGDYHTHADYSTVGPDRMPSGPQIRRRMPTTATTSRKPTGTG